MTKTVAAMLTDIPGLAAEALLTWGTNPISDDGRGGKSSRLKGTMPDFVLADLDRMLALSGANDRDGLGVLSSWIRHIVDEMDADGIEPDWPADSVPDACAWLIVRLPWVESNPLRTEGLADDVQRLWRALRAICRVVDRRPWPCLTEGCSDHMEPAKDGDYLTCGAGHKHAGLSKWRFHPSMPIPDLSASLNISERTLRHWVSRGLIATDESKDPPTGRGRRPSHAWPWDVLRMQYPGLVEAIEQHDAA